MQARVVYRDRNLFSCGSFEGIKAPLIRHCQGLWYLLLAKAVPALYAF